MGGRLATNSYEYTCLCCLLLTEENHCSSLTNIGSHRISCNGGHQFAHRMKVHVRKVIKLFKSNVLM